MKRYSSSNRVSILTSLLCVASVTVFLASARAQEIAPPYRPDLIGTRIGGTAKVTIDKTTQTAKIKEGTIVLRSDITDCDLMHDPVCPVTIELINLQVDTLKFESTEVRAMNVRNQGSIPLPNLDTFIPPGVLFNVEFRLLQKQQNSSLIGVFEVPSGALISRGERHFGDHTQTLILLDVILRGTLANHKVIATFTLDLPLVNQQPIARASSSSSIDPTTGASTIVLDASATTDPDGNLASLRWFDEDGTFVGQGPIIKVPVKPGKLQFGFLLVAEDDIGAMSTAMITVTPSLTVGVDIEPGEFPNLIHISHDPNRIWVTTVAILTSPNFDATTVDSTTVRFGKTGAEAAPVHAAPTDVDGDGTLDAVFLFHTQDTGLQCGDTSAALTGKNLTGQRIAGSDAIVTVRGGAICP
jgi:hypothetical protein